MIKLMKVRWAGHVGQMGRRLCWWENQKERPLGSPKCRWVYNIKMDLREIGCVGVDGIDLAYDRDQ
jgi:hypothetical protein